MRRGRVDFALIGGLAVVAHGYPRLTRDVDICYATAHDNLEALARVLGELHARLRGIEETSRSSPTRRCFGARHC